MRRIVIAGLTLATIVSLGYAGAVTQERRGNTASSMTTAAQQWIESLGPDQQETIGLAYDSPERVGWHFIPKAERKGLQLRDMDDAQRDAAYRLLRSCLSQSGYGKATRVMAIEDLLHELEQGRGANIRDSVRYFFTVFGEVSEDSRWGLSIEGHHLSLNFVVEGDRVESMTPMFFGINPTVTNREFGTFRRGARVLAQEELIAFELVQSLNDDQLQVARIAEAAPSDIRAAGETHPPTTEAEGIAFSDLDTPQQSRLMGLVNVYLRNMPNQVAQTRRQEIEEAGWEQVKFCWLGALRPGIGHAYRIEGPTFLIEFNNTQADAEGNPASHIHSVWRDPRGDFGLPIGG